MREINFKGKRNEIREFAFIFYPYLAKALEDKEVREDMRVLKAVSMRREMKVDLKMQDRAIKSKIKELILKGESKSTYFWIRN